MHKTLISALVLASFASLPALAQSGATPVPAPGGSVVSAADARIDAAMEAARAKVLARDLDPKVQAELVSALKAGFGELSTYTPTTDATRSRLVLAVDDIYARAAKAPIAAEEFEILRIEVLDGRLKVAVAKTWVDPRTGTVTTVLEPLGRLCDAAKPLDPAIQDMRTRAQAIVDALVKKGSFVAADLEPLTLEISAGAMMRTVTILERRGMAKTVLAIDFTRARDHVADHFALLGKSDSSAAERKAKLIAAIDTLEKKSRTAPLAAADFTELKSLLNAGARTASSTK